MSMTPSTLAADATSHAVWPQTTDDPSLLGRQLWGLPTQAPYTSTVCPNITLPSGAVLSINPTLTYTLSGQAIFMPNCSNSSIYNDTSVIFNFKDPFYSSTTPLIYVIAVCTVLAWVLMTVVMVAPSPSVRTRSGDPFAWLKSARLSSMMRLLPPLFSAASRPWLQKIAALLVAIAMTIASVYTFEIAQIQYIQGYANSLEFSDHVSGAESILVFQVVSNIFLWLAQVQTLIRLFPRHKEKLIIKWFGFLLIILDLLFSIWQTTFIRSHISPRYYRDAIPALSYLFELALGLLYAAWVIYYAITKRRYAFYHETMPSITIVALLAIVSVLIPVVFFIMDIALPDISAWGDYFRWVGAAAASIIVWEWVERIEIVEREEKRDGILGREMFDEDEATVLNSSSFSGGSGGSEPKAAVGRDKEQPAASISRIGDAAHSFFRARMNKKKRSLVEVPPNQLARTNIGQVGVFVSPPQHHAHNMPPSRTETTSADTTVYEVTYHPVRDTPAIPQLRRQISENESADPENAISGADAQHLGGEQQNEEHHGILPSSTMWRRNMPNVFKRRKKSPPPEIKQAISGEGKVSKQSLSRLHATSKSWLSNPPTRQSLDGEEQYNEARRKAPVAKQPTIIAAPPRGQTWSPHEARHSTRHNTDANDDNVTDTVHDSSTPATTKLVERLPTPQRLKSVGPGESSTESGSASTSRGASDTPLITIGPGDLGMPQEGEQESIAHVEYYEDSESENERLSRPSSSSGHGDANGPVGGR